MAVSKKKPSKTGQVETQDYEPGVKLPEQEPIPEGRYKFVLLPAGKKGREWRKKDPKSYPYKRLLFKAMNADGEVVQDEATGGDAVISTVTSSAPKAFFMVHGLAYAAGYPEKLQLPIVDTPKDPRVEERCERLDELINFIEENELALNGYATETDRGGRRGNDIRWEPPDDEENEGESEEASEEEEESEEEAEETEEASEEEPEEEEEQEEEAPAPKKKGRGKK